MSHGRRVAHPSVLRQLPTLRHLVAPVRHRPAPPPTAPMHDDPFLAVLDAAADGTLHKADKAGYDAAPFEEQAVASGDVEHGSMKEDGKRLRESSAPYDPFLALLDRPATPTPPAKPPQVPRAPVPAPAPPQPQPVKLLPASTTTMVSHHDSSSLLMAVRAVRERTRLPGVARRNHRPPSPAPPPAQPRMMPSLGPLPLSPHASPQPPPASLISSSLIAASQAVRERTFRRPPAAPVRNPSATAERAVDEARKRRKRRKSHDRRGGGSDDEGRGDAGRGAGKSGGRGANGSADVTRGRPTSAKGSVSSSVSSEARAKRERRNRRNDASGRPTLQKV